MKLNEIADHPGSAQGRACASAAASAPARARPPAAASRARRRAPASRIKGFEGGQMPLHRRLPKRGFNNIFAQDYTEVSLGRIQEAIDAGKLDAKAPVTAAALKAAGVIRRAQGRRAPARQRRAQGDASRSRSPAPRSRRPRRSRRPAGSVKIVEAAKAAKPARAGREPERSGPWHRQPNNLQPI